MRITTSPLFFFFNDTATTEIYTLSLHDALPISPRTVRPGVTLLELLAELALDPRTVDRKSTRLNSSHSQISYAVFCLKKKKKTIRSRASTVLEEQAGLRTLRIHPNHMDDVCTSM